MFVKPIDMFFCNPPYVIRSEDCFIMCETVSVWLY